MRASVNIEKRLEKLEAVKDSRQLKPMVLHVHGWTEEDRQRVPDSPRLVIRPYTDDSEVKA